MEMGWGRERWGAVVNEDRASIPADGKVREMDSSDGCATLNVLNATKLYT